MVEFDSRSTINLCRSIFKSPDFSQKKHNYPKESASIMRKIYFQHAELYRKNIGLELLEKLFDISSVSESLLEVGSGNGNIILEFLQNNHSLHKVKLSFIEPDSSAAAALSFRFPKADIYNENLELFLNKITNVGSFDIIFANFSLHWVSNIESRLDHLRNLLTQEGVIGFSNTDSNRSFWADIDRQVKIQFPDCSLFNIENSHSLTSKQWLEIFERKGFSFISETQYQGVAAVFESPSLALNNFKTTVGKNYLKLSAGITAQQVETFVLQILDKKKNSEGQVEINASGYSMVFKKCETNY